MVPISPAFADMDAISPDDVARDIDWPMYIDPDLGTIPQVRVWDERMKGIWAACLRRPDVETRRRAIHELGEAHALGMPGLATFIDELIKQMNEPDQHPVLVLAAAKTLIQLDAKQAAAAFLTHNQRAGEIGVIRGSTIRTEGSGPANAGIELVLMTDPALARWDHEPAKELWLKRLTDEKSPRSVRASAIAALGRSRAAAAVEALVKLAATATTSDVSLRLAAAAAAAEIRGEGFEPQATALLSGDLISRLVAATLLSQHKSPAAIRLLQTLAGDGEPTVAAIAAGRLLQIDPLLLKDQAGALLASNDPKVRHLAAQALAAQKSPAAIAVLGPRLGDASPQVRYFIRRQFIEFDKDAALSPAVREQADKLLAGAPAAWRGIEAAATILGRLDVEAAAPRLVSLLAHPRDEVRMAAIVALRRLAIADDNLLRSILAHAAKESDEFLRLRKLAEQSKDRPFRVNGEQDRQLSQLLQLLGIMRYAPAQPLMERYIPKKCGFWTEARGGAIWAMGLMHEGKADARLTAAFVSRLNDLDPNDPEMTVVRRMSATSIARMNAMSALGELRKFHKSEINSLHIGGSCRWGIMKMTGEKLPPLDPYTIAEVGWVIQPLEK